MTLRLSPEPNRRISRPVGPEYARRTVHGQRYSVPPSGMLVAELVTFQQAGVFLPGLPLAGWRGGADRSPVTVTGRSLPLVSKIIGSAYTPSSADTHLTRPAAPSRPASGPMTWAVSAWPGKKAGSMTVPGVTPFTTTVPRGACASATRAVAT